MASRLGQAAKRLGEQQWRGLANALSEGAAPSSSLGQPVAAAALRAHSSSAGAGGLPAAAAAALRSGDAAGAGPSSATAAAAAADAAQAASTAAAAAAAAAQKPPEGHTDFSKKDLVMIFTCAKCDTRAAKAFSKQSYHHGVVIVDCPGCHAKHLIADHLGWFGHKGTVEDFAAEKGNLVMRKLADGTMELTLADIVGSAAAAGGEAGAGGEAAAAAVGEGAGAQ